jgi:hypothetical protein
VESGRNVTQLLVRNFLKAVGVWWFPPMVLQVQLHNETCRLIAASCAMPCSPDLIIFGWRHQELVCQMCSERLRVLRLQMGSLAVSATWGLLLYVCTRFSWAHYDTGKQEVCGGMRTTCTSSSSTALACTQPNRLPLIYMFPHNVMLTVRQAILLGALAFVMAFIVLSFCSSVSECWYVYSCCCHACLDGAALKPFVRLILLRRFY